MSFDLQEKYYAQNEEQKFQAQAFFLQAELTKGAHFTGELLDTGVVRGGLLVVGVMVKIKVTNGSIHLGAYGGALIFKGKCSGQCIYNRLKIIS